MLFSSNIFIFAFLPLVVLIYFLLHKPYRNYFLLLASLIFYAWGEPVFVFAMIGSIAANYTSGMLIHRYRNNKRASKGILAVTVILNLGLLFAFKYLNFAIFNVNRVFGDVLPATSILLPIGISFFTFQALSYVIDVYRGKVAVQRNPLFVGLYISLFPQLIAGPIVRYSTIEKQISDRRVTFDDFSEGVRRFIIGLCKKVILANNLAIVADKAFATTTPGELSVSFAWLGAICYAFQILFDFSGYSDMALGLGRMFGFRFLENFDYPYISKSITEFWRRWHISLGTWFRDYVYIPLGGSRVEKRSRLVFNLFVVWLLTGVWHGASWNFVAWGLLYCVLLVFEKLSGYPARFKKGYMHIVYRIFTLLCVLGGWVLFRATTMQNALKYGLSMLGLTGNPVFDDVTIFYLHENWLFLLFALLCSTPIFRLLKQKSAAFTRAGKIMQAASVCVLLFLFLVSVSYLVVGSHNPFIYFNF